MIRFNAVLGATDIAFQLRITQILQRVNTADQPVIFKYRLSCRDRVLPAEQVVPDAPWQICTKNLYTDAVTTAIAHKHRPCRNVAEKPIPVFTEVSKGGAQ